MPPSKWPALPRFTLPPLHPGFRPTNTNAVHDPASVVMPIIALTKRGASS
jgi:hypothetical protein